MTPWTITFGDHTWTDEQVTTAHAVAVAELIGDTWDAVSPWTGPKSLAAWIAVLEAARVGGKDAFETAVVAVYSLPIAALTECLHEREAAVQPAEELGLEPELAVAAV